MSDEFGEDEDVRVATKGIEIEKEIADSPTLRYVLQRAQIDAEAAIDAFVEADPTDIPEVIRLQAEVRRDRDLREWIADAIEAGRQAEERIREEDGLGT